MLSTLFAASEDATKKFVDLDIHLYQWAALVGFIVVLLLLDLVLVHRKPHVISAKEAGIESAVWISIGLAFGVVLWIFAGGAAAGEYYSGFLIEKSLSIDNVFVWAVIFSFFGVPKQYQFRVLFWGVFGALVLRAIFIFAGVALIDRFDWVLYVFGAFLLVTAVRIARHDESEEVDYEANIVMRLVRRVVHTTNEYDGQKLFTVENGKRVATPLFAVLILIEATDVLFAVDSVPAVLAVSNELFIVFASNAFAILGLRALYFLVGGMQGRFRYLNVGLGLILGFVGIKMLIVGDPINYHVPTPISLGFIAAVLTIAIVASLRADAAEGHPGEHADGGAVAPGTPTDADAGDGDDSTSDDVDVTS